MSDTTKSGITIYNSNDSFFHVKYLVAIDSESQRLAVLSRQLPAAGFAGFRIPKEAHLVFELTPFQEFKSSESRRGPTALDCIALEALSGTVKRFLK